MGLALALALALGASDPCVGTDELGRSFRTCFAQGKGLELSTGGAWGDGPGQGLRASDSAGEVAAGFALRWRSDTTSGGRREWLRDMAFLEARGRFHDGYGNPRSAEGTLWSGLFLRRLSEPFLLIPAPKPIRFPFPFDVGMAIDAGVVRWAKARPGVGEALDVEVMRGALLLDVARHLGENVRRAAFGPEVSWGLRFEEGSRPVQSVAPFSAGRLEFRAESDDGLTALFLTGRAGALIRLPGGTGFFYDGRLGLERVLIAVNDVPLSVYGEAAARGGAVDRALEATVGLRLGAFR
jgi:hypothetical protein